jgi:hypothetical protein
MIATRQRLSSNFDTDMSVNNLKRELLGKYSVSHETQEKKKKVKTNKVSWSNQDKRMEMIPQEFKICLPEITHP